jgi:glutamate/tyrosine decarboxylase-like PLP-dependent enzyme
MQYYPSRIFLGVFKVGLSKGETAAIMRAVEHSISYRQNVSDQKILPKIDAAEATRLLGGTLNEMGQDAAAVIDTIVADGDAGLMHFVSPRFFGYVVGASHPVGLAADILCSAWGQNSAYAAATPTSVVMENAVCSWVIDLLGLPAECGAGIVTGATLGNTAAVMAARNALLRRSNWDVEAQGLFGAPEIQVVIGAEAHSATAAALRYAGLGAERVHRVRTDDQGRMRTDDFRETIKDLSGPILVILQAGHINSGGYDPFAEIIPIARKKQAWVHVDGAFGLWVNAVPELSHRLTGVEDADSWAVDLHKWLNAPYDAGMVITRDREPLVTAMSAKAAYLPSAGAVQDMGDTVPELSRRARGIPSYAILKTMGKRGVREMVARHCELAQWVAAELSNIPGLTVLNDVACNQVAFHCGAGAARDVLTPAVLDAIHQEGLVYPSHGDWRGGPIIRVSVIGHQTSKADVEVLVASIKRAWAKVAAENNAV